MNFVHRIWTVYSIRHSQHEFPNAVWSSQAFIDWLPNIILDTVVTLFEIYFKMYFNKCTLINFNNILIRAYKSQAMEKQHFDYLKGSSPDNISFLLLTSFQLLKQSSSQASFSLLFAQLACVLLASLLLCSEFLPRDQHICGKSPQCPSVTYNLIIRLIDGFAEKVDLSKLSKSLWSNWDKTCFFFNFFNGCLPVLSPRKEWFPPLFFIQNNQ